MAILNGYGRAGTAAHNQLRDENGQNVAINIAPFSYALSY